jgi:hypothetical protein
MATVISIQFLQWEKWNPRKDIKEPKWFALSNRITEDDQLQALSDVEFRAFIHLACLASQQNKDGWADVNLEKAWRVTGIDAAVFANVLKKLAAFGICVERDPNEPRPEPINDPYGSRTDHVHDTNEQRTDPVRTVSGSSTDPVQNPNATLQDKTIHNTTRQERETRAREEVFEPKTVDELRSAFDDDARKVWRELYPDSEFRKTESLKCFEYWRNDPTRPKTVDGWKQKLGSWFSLGWEKRISPGGASRQSKPPPAAIRELPSEAVLAQSAAMSARLEAEAEPVEIDLEKLPPAMRQLALKVIPGRAG